jgi:hypothetical protein
MEKRVNVKLDEFITKFKNDIRTKAIELNFADSQKSAELLEFVYEYEKMALEKDDFTKRKRVKNAIPNSNRCTAKRANGEQCTRRRKDSCEFCGTHSKGVPHGLIGENGESAEITHKVEVFAQEIKGIVYYIDAHLNVYKTEDVLEGKENPKIVAKCVKNDNSYSIPDFGLL